MTSFSRIVYTKIVATETAEAAVLRDIIMKCEQNKAIQKNKNK